MNVGDVVTLGSFERAMARVLSNPFDPRTPEIPEPSQDELLEAIARVRPVYNRSCDIIDPSGRSTTGVLQPRSLGLRFIYFAGNGIDSRSYSAEMLRGEGSLPHPVFQTDEVRAVSPLYRLDYAMGYVGLRRAGVRR